MPSLKKKTYTARICWNSNKWTFPSGDAGHLETGTYVVEAGFGHEEWLFNFSWLVDGFHYGFLQPVSNSFDKVSGKSIDVLLYTINPSGDRCYVGEISTCQVLTLDQAKLALDVYRKHGWLKSMAEQVGNVGGKVDYILGETNARHLFNVRFKREDVSIYDPLRLATRHETVWTRNRYTLALADKKASTEWRRKGTTSPPLIKTITRKGVPGVTYDPVHKRLQADLFRLFQERYGKGNVVLERDNVDITVTEGVRTILIEIKTDPSPRGAIREALGQLLEYGYYEPSRAKGTLDLVIIAPGTMDRQAEKYMGLLRSQFKIPISYYSYAEGDPLPKIGAQEVAQVVGAD